MSAVRDGSSRSSQKQFRLSDLFKSCNIGHTLVIGCNIGLMDDECNEDSILITYSQMLRSYQYSVKVCTQARVFSWFPWSYKYYHSSLDEILVPYKITPLDFIRLPWDCWNPLHSWVERGIVKVECFSQEHDTLTLPGLDCGRLDWGQCTDH